MKEVVFQVEIISGRGITTVFEAEYLQHIQLHVLFQKSIRHSERVDFVSPDPIFRFASDFTLWSYLTLLLTLTICLKKRAKTQISLIHLFHGRGTSVNRNENR